MGNIDGRVGLLLASKRVIRKSSMVCDLRLGESLVKPKFGATTSAPSWEMLSKICAGLGQQQPFWPKLDSIRTTDSRNRSRADISWGLRHEVIARHRLDHFGLLLRCPWPPSNEIDGGSSVPSTVRDGGFSGHTWWQLLALASNNGTRHSGHGCIACTTSDGASGPASSNAPSCAGSVVKHTSRGCFAHCVVTPTSPHFKASR